MDAPWPLCLIAVRTSLLDPLWLHPGGPVWDPFLVHFGDGFGTHFGAHFGAHLERLNYPVEEQEGIRKLRRSVSQPGKLPLHASQVILSPRIILGRVQLRKLHGRLRSQLELPRQPSEGCSIGALGPVPPLDRLWFRMGGVKHHQ